MTASMSWIQCWNQEWTKLSGEETVHVKKTWCLLGGLKNQAWLYKNMLTHRLAYRWSFYSSECRYHHYYFWVEVIKSWNNTGLLWAGARLGRRYCLRRRWMTYDERNGSLDGNELTFFVYFELLLKCDLQELTVICTFIVPDSFLYSYLHNWGFYALSLTSSVQTISW